MQNSRLSYWIVGVKSEGFLSLSTDLNLFESLLETWFPLGKEPPKAYLVDTSEEALLIPDWLKLRMIRSNVDRLVDAALTDLEPPQLVLFIQSFGIPVKSMRYFWMIRWYYTSESQFFVGDTYF